MKPHDDLAAKALRALGDQCAIPRDVEDRILAALPLDLSGEALSEEPERSAAGPTSGVFRATEEPAASRALAALADQCEIPPELSDRILDRALEAPAPVVRVSAPVMPAPAHEPLRGLIRRAQRDATRTRRIGLGAVASALLLAAVLLLMGSPPAGTPAPVNVNATQVREGDPLLDEIRTVLSGLLGDVNRECHIDLGSAVLWFEKSGQIGLLQLPHGSPRDMDCFHRSTAGFRLRPHDQAILVQLSVRRDAPGRPSDESSPGKGTRVDVRITAWLVDET